MNNNIGEKHLDGNYYPAFDGLRGFAILLILLYHNFSSLSIFRLGWVGVDLFFVLSGFLITEILLKKRESPGFLGNFYMRRVLRILPVYYLSLIIFLYILPFIFRYPFDISFFLKNQYWFWMEGQNWLFIIKPNENNGFLNHFWSLALEEQFYLISPIIILSVRSLQKLVRLLFVILLLLILMRILVWQLQFKNFSYVSLYAFTRIDGLCIGSLLAIFRYQGNFWINNLNRILAISVLVIVFLVLPSFRFFYRAQLPYLACCAYPAIALVCGFFVWSSILPDTWIYKVFKNRFLIFIGKLSYSLYVFHWPVYKLFTSSDLTICKTNPFIVGIMASVLTLVMALLSYYAFERYFLQLKRYFR